MLVLTRKCDEKIRINKDIVVTVIGIKKGRAVLGIDAPSTVHIVREEIAHLPPGKEREHV
jgi:carbon storage regulator